MLWDLRPTGRSRIDVTTANRGIKPRRSIDLHRVRSLDPQDVTVHAGIPCTTVARTLVDLAAILDDRDLKRTVARSEHTNTLDVAAVTDAIERGNGKRGVKRLAALIHQPAAPTRSELEDRFLDLVTEAGLPAPMVNVPFGPYVLDFFWPQHGLVVETDGRWHRVGDGPEDDAVRDAELTVAGLRVVRFTWRRVTERPEEVRATLRALLAL
jgi:hypothetical protein